jgi:hypothetical protein
MFHQPSARASCSLLKRDWESGVGEGALPDGEGLRRDGDQAVAAYAAGKPFVIFQAHQQRGAWLGL